MRERVTRTFGGLMSAAKAQAMESPVAVSAAIMATLLFARVALLQLSTMALPLVVHEGHHWRQAFTYGVAWNFAHTTLDVLRPRMFAELALSNVVPMEAPLYPLVSSILMRVMGDSIVAPRLVSWLGLVATVMILWKWLAEPKSARGQLADRAGLLVALGLSPIVAVEFHVIQPEAMAEGLAIASAFFYVRYGESERRKDLVLGAACFGLSLLAKPLALGIAPGLALFAACSARQQRIRRGLVASSALIFALLPWAAWDRWAHHMLETDLGGNWVIEIGHPMKAMITSLLGGEWSRAALLEHIPNFASSWWLVPAIFAGVFRGLAERRWRRYTLPFLAWLIGYSFQLLAIGIRLHSNAYYVILALAPLAYFVALGLGALVRLLDADRSSVPLTIFRAGAALAVLLPLGWLFSRSSPWSNTIDAAQLGYDRNRLVWTSDLGLARLLVVFVIIIAIAPTVRLRRTPAWLGITVALVIAAAALRPANDAIQYFRFYAALDRRAGFDDELQQLRAAVDRYSTTSDRILVSPGGPYREPILVYFYYARRNGFALREPNLPLNAMVRRGARLYLQVDQLGPENHAVFPGRALASGAWWRLSCVADDRCPDPTPR